MTTARRREREAERRRQAILAAARKLFWKQGYERATMPQIAAAAEVAAGTLYLYFPGKEALYAALLAEGYERLEGALADAAGRGKSPRDRAKAMIDAFFAFARRYPEYFDIIFFLLQREGKGGWHGKFLPQQVEGLEERMQACKRVASRILAEADPGLSAAALRLRVDTVWSLLSGAIFYFKGTDAYGSIAEEAARILLGGLFPDARSPKGRKESAP
ncbi:MAG: TetR/AcrR family transcriptional regulator [Planctomycetes bacterium]|nr:TetR/AcrR family transcriptional regulator [Planctomycetota bacterium]